MSDNFTNYPFIELYHYPKQMKSQEYSSDPFDKNFLVHLHLVYLRIFTWTITKKKKKWKENLFEKDINL